MKFSIIILYFNRYDYLLQIVNSIALFNRYDIDLTIVDNNSAIDASNDFKDKNITYLRLDNNYGAVARNRGIAVAKGEYILCLDDDVIGITETDLMKLEGVFHDDNIAAVCFKVIDPAKGNVINWIHHYNKDKYSNKKLYTNEISEGAVCFRKKALDQVGLYYEKYFISHEGPDLACRLINNNYDIIYFPEIVVKHYHSDICRDKWRRYYYDTRNILWLSLRNYPVLYGIKKMSVGILSMLLYSIRDGFVKYWLKGLLDGIVEIPCVIKERYVLSDSAINKIKRIESNNTNIFLLMKDRLSNKNVRI